MASDLCPNCGKPLEIDHFLDTREPKLFYCECGHLYDMVAGTMGHFVEVNKNEVDLSDLQGQWPSKKDYLGNHGLFIRKDRWKKIPV